MCRQSNRVQHSRCKRFHHQRRFGVGGVVEGVGGVGEDGGMGGWGGGSAPKSYSRLKVTALTHISPSFITLPPRWDIVTFPGGIGGRAGG